MKTLFLPARCDVSLSGVLKKVRFRRRLGLVTTIQHLHRLKDVQAKFKGSVIGGQVLGCDVSAARKIAKGVDAFLFIGSGEFHPLQIASETGMEVITADPLTGRVGKISGDEVRKRAKRMRGAYMKYLMADRIGILVSMKPGQDCLEEALRFRNGISKESFIFVFNTLNFNELENFPDIGCWVNTACPRIAVEDYKRVGKPIINLSDIKSFKQDT